MTRKIALLMTVLALVASACGTAQEMAQVEELAAGAPTVAETAPAPDSADGEGIEVHGHWTIEVRNPDGSLDERYEFENALVDYGKQALGELLDTSSSQATLDRWEIRAGGVVFQNPSVGTMDGDGDSFYETLVLSGTTTFGSEVDIGAVSTDMWLVFPPGDAGPVQRQFTEKVLDAPIPVLAGQEVEITVEISFS